MLKPYECNPTLSIETETVKHNREQKQPNARSIGIAVQKKIDKAAQILHKAQKLTDGACKILNKTD